MVPSGPEGPPAWLAGRTYSLLPPEVAMRLFGRMKRMAWPRSLFGVCIAVKISSALNSSGAIGKPAASALVQWSPRLSSG